MQDIRGWSKAKGLESPSESSPLLPTSSRLLLKPGHPELEALEPRNRKKTYLTMLTGGLLFLFYTAAMASPRHRRPLWSESSAWQSSSSSSSFPDSSDSSEWFSPAGTALTINVGDDETVRPRIEADFPDPCVLRGEHGDWFAFATSGNGKKVQIATAYNILGDWVLLDQEVIANDAWTTGRNFWAPDVRRLDDGSYIMYVSGEVPENRRHCVGVARANSISGPYTLDDEPWECPLEQGGAIDPSGFTDPETGRMYVVYKVDGNAVGSGGECGAVMPEEGGTPLMLQEVSRYDGSSKIGEPIEILDRIGSEDGPLVEAPNLVRAADGRYVLFYSTHCFTDSRYNVRYAYSDYIWGPYTRAPEALVETPDFGFSGPGGMTSTTHRVEQGHEEVILLHGRCEGIGRCMYALPYSVVV